VTPAGLVVVGVRRSGTSVAARLASTVGLRLPPRGDLAPSNASNPEGHWESLALMACNDALLATIGCTWWTPPREFLAEHREQLAVAHKEAGAAFTSVFGVSSDWLWKDPRLAVLLPFWDNVIDTSTCLLPYREPQGVARSLEARDGLSYEQGLAVWERHTRLVLRACVGHRVAVTSYRRLLADPDAWCRDVFAFCRDAGLGVRPPPGDCRVPVRAGRTVRGGWLSSEQRPSCRDALRARRPPLPVGPARSARRRVGVGRCRNQRYPGAELGTSAWRGRHALTCTSVRRNGSMARGRQRDGAA
jgi:hypothetical protein